MTPAPYAARPTVIGLEQRETTIMPARRRRVLERRGELEERLFEAMAEGDRERVSRLRGELEREGVAS